MIRAGTIVVAQDQVLYSSLTRRRSLSFQSLHCGPFFSSSWSFCSA